MIKRPIAIIILAFVILTSCSERHSVNGVYVGYEEMCSTDSTGKKSCYGDGFSDEKWYHRSTLTILNDTISLKQVPVHFSKSRHDTTYSTADGGFYNYKGRMLKRSNKIVIDLKETSCEYCGEPVKINSDGSTTRIWRQKTYTGNFADSDIVLNGTFFKKIKGAKKGSL